MLSLPGGGLIIGAFIRALLFFVPRAPGAIFSNNRVSPENSQNSQVDNEWRYLGKIREKLVNPPKGGRCGTGAFAERATTGHNGRPPNSRRGRVRCPPILGTTLYLFLDRSWSHLGHVRNGEKPEGCRGLGVKRPPEKKGGVVGGVVRPANVGGARVAVVFIGRTYWQNLSGATHTRDMAVDRAKRGEKRFHRARPKFGRSG